MVSMLSSGFDEFHQSTGLSSEAGVAGEPVLWFLMVSMTRSQDCHPTFCKAPGPKEG